MVTAAGTAPIWWLVVAQVVSGGPRSPRPRRARASSATARIAGDVDDAERGHRIHGLDDRLGPVLAKDDVAGSRAPTDGSASIARWASGGLQAPRIRYGGPLDPELRLHRGLHVDLGEDPEPLGPEGRLDPRPDVCDRPRRRGPEREAGGVGVVSSVHLWMADAGGQLRGPAWARPARSDPALDDRMDDVAGLDDRRLREPVDDRCPAPPTLDEPGAAHHRQVLAGVRERDADGVRELTTERSPPRSASRSISRFGSVRTLHSSAWSR